jgi:hypothetical protein
MRKKHGSLMDTGDVIPPGIYSKSGFRSYSRKPIENEMSGAPSLVMVDKGLNVCSSIILWYSIVTSKGKNAGPTRKTTFMTAPDAHTVEARNGAKWTLRAPDQARARGLLPLEMP